MLRLNQGKITRTATSAQLGTSRNYERRRGVIQRSREVLQCFIQKQYKKKLNTPDKLLRAE